MRILRDPYRSRTINVNRLPFLVHLLKTAVGGLMILMVLVSIPVLLPQITDTFDSYQSFLDEQEAFSNRYPTSFNEFEFLWDNYIYALAIFLIFLGPGLVSIFWRGVLFGLSGFNNILAPKDLSKVPQDFHKDSQPFEIISSRQQYLAKLYQWTDFPRTLKAIFGSNSQLISPHQREIAAKNARLLSGRVFWLTISGLLLGGVWTAGQWLRNAEIETFFPNVSDIDRGHYLATTWLQNEEAISLLQRPFILFLVLQVLMTGIVYFSIRFMIPRRQPVFEPLENAEFYKGFSHPSQLFNRLPSLQNPFQWREFQNRTDSDWNEAASQTVKDTGTFKGWVLIEQQPKPTMVGGMFSSLILLLSGWLMMLFSTYLLLFETLPDSIPQFVQGEAGIQFPYAPYFVFAMGYVSFRFYVNGAHFAKQGMSLLESAWFKSQAILIYCEGHHSRADVRVGKANTDSIESSSIIVRSDFTARFFAGELTSEAPSLEKPRYLLGFEPNRDAHEWVDFFRNAIHTLRDDGVRPVGVDIQSEETANIMAANVQVASLKAGAEAEAARLSGQAIGQQAQLNAVAQPDLLETGNGEPTNQTSPPKTVGEIQELIDKLDIRLASGEISESLYTQLVDKWKQQMEKLVQPE